MAALIKDPSHYTSPSTQQWSAFIASCAGIIILTPQFNWGYPGELKNALDHLYWEWRDKPVMLATYGGHGGGKCATQLKQVLEGGLKMKYVCDVNITLPAEYIREAKRLRATDFEASPSADDNLATSNDLEFLEEYTDGISRALDMLLDTIKNQQTT
jgi:multimeric flavodoxin WrbA